MNVILLTSLTIITTLLGGFFAFYFRKYYHYLLGFTGGAVLSIVSFDILPELFELRDTLSLSTEIVMSTFVIGFLLFHIIEKYILIHHTHEEGYGQHRHPALGMGSAAALIGHSFLDGVGIGFAFQISTTAGFAVLFAVLAHDFADGLNTVSLMLSHNNSRLKTLIFLGLDAIAPMLGAITTLFITLKESYAVIFLGIFAGFLMYICASDILPEAHSEKSKWSIVAMTIFGVIFMFLLLELMH